MLPSPVRPVLAALLAACASEPPAPPPPRAPRVLVPPEQLSLRTETLPVQVELPAAAVGETPVVRLDGAEVDATAFIRAWGPRALLIGELDLSKTSEGVHSLEVSTPSTSIDRTFSLTRPPCPLTLQVRDHKRQPTPARVVIWDAEGPLSILGEASPKEDRSKREAALDSVFVPTGTGRVWLDPGAHTLAATRGLRAGVAIATVDACETPELELVLGQGLSTTRRAADLHVHTGHSPDAWIPDPRRLRSLATSGLDVAVITDHNTLDWPALDRSSPQQLLGVEHTHGPQGLPLAHLNAFPIAPEATLPDSTGRSLAGTLDDLRALPGVRYVQLDHPRGVDLRLLPNAQPVKAPPYKAGTTLLDRSMSYAIWSYPGLDRLAPLSADANAWLQRPDPNTGTNALEVDAVEVLNRSSVSRWLEVRADWFYLLNRGVWLTGTGNSDSHDAAVELAREQYVVRGDPQQFVDAVGPCMPLGQAAAMLDRLVHHWKPLQGRGRWSNAYGTSRDPEVLFRRHLDALVDAAAKRGTTVLMLDYPNPRHEYEGFQEQFQQYAQQRGVPFLDMFGRFNDRFSADEWDALMAPGGHCNADGYAVMAEEVIAALRDDPELAAALRGDR